MNVKVYTHTHSLSARENGGEVASERDSGGRKVERED